MILPAPGTSLLAVNSRWYAAVVRLLAFLAFVASLAASSAFAQGDDVLVKLVVVSRHGVRTPLPPSTELATWAAQPWPDWNQPAGALTPRGAQLASLMGRYYRLFASEAGAITAAGCPAAGTAYVYADNVERTQATAQALLDGFAPNCALVYRTRAQKSPDPLFHPLETGVCRVDPLTAQTKVLERAGGDLNTLARDMKAPFDTLQSALQCCAPALCTAFGRGDKCTLAELPTALSPGVDGAGLGMIGSLAIASSAAELFLLEYADNLPLSDVAWGRVTPAQMRDTWRLHTLQYDLMQRTPYLARRMGSALLHKVGAAVTSARQLGFGVPDPAVRDAKFVAYVGHDTNIWNLAGILDVSWLQPPYQRNQTPPAGALVFEVREAAADKKLRVYASYIAQSPDQMRNATPLSAESLPLRTALRVPGCSTAAPGFPCAIEEFAVALRNVIDRDCVE